MFFNAIGTSVPTPRYTKAQCWEAFAASPWFLRLEGRTRAVARAVLMRDNGIAARHLAVDRLEDVFNIEPDILHQRFEHHAPSLATEAARQALQRARLRPVDIDAVVVSTCTGYLCPGLSGYVIERIGMRADAQAFDLVGQGCAAALPNFRLGHALLAADHARHVLSICVEVSSAAMYLDDDPGVIISACLFGDGAGAAVLSREPGAGRSVRWHDGASSIDPTEREALRFQHRGGMLRNVLTLPVPKLAAAAAHEALTHGLAQHGLHKNDISAWILHAGGRDVLAALRDSLDLEQSAVATSARVLHDYGNLSSAFVYFVLDAALNEGAMGGWWWLASFGAGFSCHAALLEVAANASGSAH